MKSIGHRLALYFGLMVVLACVGFGILVYNYTTRTLIEAASLTFPEYAKTSAYIIDSSLKTQLTNLEMIAQRNEIRQLNWPEQKSALTAETSLLGYLYMGFASQDGQLKTTVDTTLDISNNSAFLQALEGKSAISVLAGSDYTLLLASPVKDHSNNIIGVVTAAWSGQDFSDEVTAVEIKDSGSVFVVDNSGRLIAHPDYNLVSQGTNLLDQEDDENHRDLAAFLASNMDRKTGLGYYTWDGIDYLAALAPVNANQWFVVIQVPHSEIMAPLRDIHRNLVFTAALLLLLGFGITYLATKQIAAPIRQVSQRYARMAAGDFNGTLDQKLQKRGDEIGQLARGFIQINHSLSRTISELEASEQRFRMITENMVDLVALTDLNGYMQYVSPSHEYIIGWKVRHIVGKCVFDAIHPDDVEHAKEAYANIIKTKEPGSFTYRCLRADGEYRWLETKGRPLLDAKGQVVSLVTASRDIHERRQSEEQIRYLAEHDALTGLYNRSYFENQMRILDEMLVVPVSLIICDLDGLKFVNDTLGHQAGDELLLAAADIISNAAPEGSIIARIGGDEFAVLLPEYSDKLAGYVADNIRNAVAQYNITHPDILSISMGVAYRLTPELSMSAVFKEADQQMDREKLLHNQSARSAVVDVVMSALEARDFVTEGHTDRLQTIATTIARRLEWPENRINDLTLFARFHDIGKVGVPDSILFKTGRLTAEEFEEMKKHSEIGYRIAQSSPDLVHIADFILKHHEWWNGNGYPLGLKGEEIPLECRIVAVADAYDAMNSDRPYRKALPQDKIIQELKDGAGTQFDPGIIEIFLQILGENGKEP